MLHLEEPLRGELRLYGYVGALGEPHLVVVVLHFLHQSGLLQVGGNLHAHVHAVFAHIHAGFLGECAVGVEDVDGLQSMFQPQCVVVHIVGGSHF